MQCHPNARILVIDDEPSIHDDFRSILSPHGETDTFSELEEALFGTPAKAPRAEYDMVSAFQGDEGAGYARDALGEGIPFRLAFVDMRMPPGWDGLRTVKELWRADPRLQVVICTAYSDYAWDEVLTELDARGRLLVVKKPFDPVEVSQAAATLSAKWTLEEELARCRASCGTTAGDGEAGL